MNDWKSELMNYEYKCGNSQAVSSEVNDRPNRHVITYLGVKTLHKTT